MKSLRKDKPVLVIMVASHYGKSAVKARHMIRRTWGGVTEYEGVTVHRVFLFGECPSKKRCSVIYKEEERYGDILMSNYFLLLR